jgi:adenylate cyclase class 2
MAIETEIKLSLPDPSGFRRRLVALGAELAVARHFEDNLVLDFPGGVLKGRGCVVRLRRAGGRSILTYKGPARAQGPFKSREEIETTVADGAAALVILERLGLETWFRYQKFREEYRVDLPGFVSGTLHVAVDETPVGAYAELEGTEEGIRELAGALGFSETDFLRESYYTLHARRRRESGQPIGPMVFSGAVEGG